jgi:hypothetical protein
MYSNEDLLKMISSNKASTRYDACEWLRVRRESSPEIVHALDKATHDEDVEVALRAYLALQADVHHQMAIDMGVVEPDEQQEKIIEETGFIKEEEAQPNNIVKNNYAAMLKEIRSWGFWSLGLGAVHLVTSGFLSAPWGVLLIIVGLASFYFRTASMFIIYAVTLAWAALSNLLGLDFAWIFFCDISDLPFFPGFHAIPAVSERRAGLSQYCRR